jgi:hypothetical protein
MSTEISSLNITQFRHAVRQMRKIVNIDVMFIFNDNTVENHKINVPPQLQNDYLVMLFDLLHLVGNRAVEVKSIACTDTTCRIPFMQPVKVYDMDSELHSHQISIFKNHLKKCQCSDVHLRAQEVQRRVKNGTALSWLDAEESD